MKSLMLLAREMLTDVSIWCHVSTTRDFKTITSRVEHEGLSFLTITLTSIAQDLEKGLEQGYVDHTMFASFSKHGTTPRFLGGLFDRVFDRASGRLLDNADPIVIQSIRQISLAFGKISLPCSDARVRKAIGRYVECESEVREFDRTFHNLEADFTRVSSMLWARMLTKLNARVISKDIFPKHGPGATADGLRANAKWTQSSWTDRLEAEFPMAEFAFSSYSEYFANIESLHFSEPGSEMPVKVITVPKTLKTPRIIAIEPTCMQYTQQAILRAIVEEMSRDDYAKHFVEFKSQLFNQQLALEGSIDRSLATLDLSEASDRVSNQHVRALLRRHGALFRAVDACRSRKADVPGHGVIRLSKFASMGSALCFPFEAMVFTTIVFLGIEQKLNRRLRHKDILSLRGKVRVYGDDIIVPADYVNSVVGALEAFGLRVNLHKSFWNGSFRESCGKEYFKGHDVSITRVRRLLPTQRTDSAEIVSTVALRNQLYHSGYWNTVKYLDTIIERFIPFPIAQDTSPGLTRSSYLPYCMEKYDTKLHRPLVRAAVVVPRPSRSALDGYGALVKCLLPGRIEPLQEKHLEFAGRPTAVDIKRRWVPTY